MEEYGEQTSWKVGGEWEVRNKIKTITLTRTRGFQARSYKMIEWKLNAINILISAVDEIIDGESIRLVHVLGASDRLKHWTDNDIRIDDCQVE